MNTPRPVPRHIDFTGKLPTREHSTWYQYDFDPDEIIAAFQALGAASRPLDLVFRRFVEDKRYRYDVVLRNGETQLPLPATKVRLNRGL